MIAYIRPKEWRFLHRWTAISLNCNDNDDIKNVTYEAMYRNCNLLIIDAEIPYPYSFYFFKPKGKIFYKQ